MYLLKTLALAGGAIAIAGVADAQTYRFGGGPWHPAVSAGTQLINKELKGKPYKFQYSPSNGSVDNVRRVGLGDFATAWGHVVQSYQSWYGVGLFKKDGINRDFRVVANVRSQTQIVAVLSRSPIKTFSDMKGKVVNLLSKGSGSNVNCTNIFKGLGLLDQIKPRYLGFAASARALGDRQIDVFCSAGAPYKIPALTELSLRKPVRYISMSASEQKKLTSAYKFYAPITIPLQKDVKGMTEPARSFSYPVFWYAHKQMSEDAIYNMVKIAATPANLKKLASTAGYWKTLSGDFEALKAHKMWVHPAAARYWKERGVNVPAELIKGF
jgi:TRAP transporter TAXI family solute receptor